MTLPPANPPPPEPADKQLMRSVKKGDQDAFATLVRRHQNGVLNFFGRMGDYRHAEDLTQETFVRLFKYRKQYRPTAKFTTFLYLLARRTWIDHCRARDRRQQAYARLANENEVRRPAGTDALEDARDRVAAALETLSEEMRTVVVLSVYQGFKYREIAKILRIPLGTVKTRMFHAMQKLREQLDDENEA